MGHYETLKESLVAAVKDSTGVGLSGVVYKGVPTTGYTLLADMVSSGLPASNSSTVLGLRVDYLDADNSMKTVFYRDSRYTGADPWSALNDWLPTNSPSIIQSDFNSQIAMDISGNAPAGWTTADNGARRIQVSLILQGVSGKAEVEARLTD
jgi:hypothetical protein